MHACFSLLRIMILVKGFPLIFSRFLPLFFFSLYFRDLMLYQAKQHDTCQYACAVNTDIPELTAAPGHE